MKTFKELCDGKPSNAIKAMIDGLIEQDARPDFTINMSTFGDQEGIKCFGCAATSTIQKLTGINFVPGEKDRIDYAYSRAQYLKVNREDLVWFEGSIDRLRKGEVYAIFSYFRVERLLEVMNYTGPYWYLTTENWRTELPKVEAYMNYLFDLGL